LKTSSRVEQEHRQLLEAVLSRDVEMASLLHCARAGRRRSDYDGALLAGALRRDRVLVVGGLLTVVAFA
jgi:DNA-binding GntR family transcriptional regulator